MIKDKFHKDYGTKILFCELRVNKSTKQVEFKKELYTVLVSSETNYVCVGKYNTFTILDRGKKNYNSNSVVNKLKTYEQKWNMKSMDDYISTYVYSTLSEKATKNRLKKALIAFVKKESYFYYGLDKIIEDQFNIKETV